MARIRISGPAREDLARVLAMSSERWGGPARTRYAKLLAAALRAFARKPEAGMTRDRAELSEGLRSFHVRHVRASSGVKQPAHVIFYRVGETHIEIVRVLHEQMDPSRHIDSV